MPARSSFDYAVIRVVPRVEREEFINAGVLLYCLSQRFLEARVQLNPERLKALAPDIDLAMVEEHLASVPLICAGGPAAGPLGALSQKERFHWLVAPRSTIIQASPVHSGLCERPDEALEKLLDRMVR